MLRTILDINIEVLEWSKINFSNFKKDKLEPCPSSKIESRIDQLS